MTIAEKRAAARRLRDEGLTQAQIADQLGYRHSSSIARLLRDPAKQREILRRSNAKRGPAKRAWAHAHDRGQCPCGAMMGAGSKHRGYILCRDCRDDVVAIGRAMRQERIADMWAAGHKLREIADALDTTAASIGVEMSRMRDRGWDLPRRHNWTVEGLDRAQTARAKWWDA